MSITTHQEISEILKGCEKMSLVILIKTIILGYSNLDYTNFDYSNHDYSNLDYSVQGSAQMQFAKPNKNLNEEKKRGKVTKFFASD